MSAVNYTDDFTTRPAALDPNPSGAFTTGTAAIGLSYSGSPADLFAWSGSGEVDCDAFSAGGSGSFTITSRDGKAFVFNSIQWKNDAGVVTVTGSGAEPFTFDIPASTGADTYTPTEGSRLVTQVEFTSSDMWALMDNVNVDFEVSRMDVQGKGITIATGDNSPDAADDTDFGSTDAGTPVTKTFTIRSYGVINLDLTGTPYVALSGSADFTVTAQPATDPITTGSSTTFAVQCNPSAAGVRTATVSIANDSGTNPYTFDVRCTGIVSAPEIDVEGNSTSIPSGDTTPASGDHTDFGNVAVGSTFDRTFTIQNEGTATLNLEGTPDVPLSVNASGDFSVLTQPTASAIVSGGADLTFVVRCTASATGDRTAIVSIANDDANEAPDTFTVKATGTAPEIDIEGNATSITDGNTTPIAGDHTDFGNVAVASSFDRTFTIQNEGTTTLNLTGTPDVALSVNASGDFSVLTQPTASSIVSGGGALTFVVRCTPSASGARTATVSIANNDANENPYTFDVKATGTTPEMDVEGNGSSIPDGDTTPSGSDHTDFGDVPAGTSVDRTFSIQNEGVATLNLTGTPDVALSVNASGDFSVLTQPAASSIASGGGALTFVVRCTPSAAGARTATLSIANNDSDENPYTFDVKATGTVPEIDVSGLGKSIVDGNATPSTADDTDFGNVLVAGGTNPNTFTIRNSGEAPLDLAIAAPRVIIGGTHAADFALDTDAATPVFSGGTTTFTITFDPSAAGQRTATISIANNDPNENPYNFAIQGTGTAPEMDVQGNGQSIIDGHIAPAVVDDTEFGDLDIAAAPIAHTFTIENTGSSDLGLTGAAPNYATVNHAAFSVTSQPTTPIASAGTTTFDVTFDPTVLGAATAIVSIANNDANENPYTFTVRGTGTAAPEMDVQGNGLSITDGDATPDGVDDTDFGDANVNANTLVRTFTIENTGSAQLNLTGPSPFVVIGGTHAADFTVTQIPTAAIAANGGTTTFQVTFDPSSGGLRTAELSVANNDTNENPYNFSIQGTGTTTPSTGGPPVTTAAATATTSAATGMTLTGATVHGTVNAGNATTTVTFQYGAESGNVPAGVGDLYTHTITAEESPIEGAGITPVRSFINGLIANTVYHFRVVATNLHGTTYGSDMTFETDALALGDLNRDDVINLLDIRLCSQIATGNRPGTAEERTQADIDEDGDVDMNDVIALSEYVLGIREELP